MNRIFKLSNKMTLDQCAQYISSALGVHVERRNVLCMISDDLLTPSWEMRWIMARRAWPVTELLGGYLNDNVIQLSGCEGYQFGEHARLNGVCRLSLVDNPAVRDWALAAARDEAPQAFSLDGVIMQDDSGQRWQALSDMGEGFEPLPFTSAIPADHFVIQRQDAEAFVSNVLAQEADEAEARLAGSRRMEDERIQHGVMSDNATVAMSAGWVVFARTTASEYINRHRAQDLFPNQSDVCEHVENIMRTRKPKPFLSEHGKPVSAKYIQRNAIQGAWWRANKP
jgi:hypothetical protein